MNDSHPTCSYGHVCQEPSGRVCIETGCSEAAGTWWGPYWCPTHDKERLDRVSAQFEDIAASFATAQSDGSE